jgi:hypothetical protein
MRGETFWPAGRSYRQRRRARGESRAVAGSLHDGTKLAGIAGYKMVGVRLTPLSALAQRHSDRDRRPRAALPPWPRPADSKARAPELEAAAVSKETDMDDPNAVAVAAQLGITLSALWSLMRNPQFPVPTSNAGDGVNINWDAAPMNAFQALMTSAKANGWIVTTAAYPTADWATMAATAIGPYYRPAFADPLFDL